LVRYFSQPAALRFGLPGEEHQWQRLEKVLSTVINSLNNPAMQRIEP
jgi:hypothetical protein